MKTAQGFSRLVMLDLPAFTYIKFSEKVEFEASEPWMADSVSYNYPRAVKHGGTTRALVSSQTTSVRAS